MSVIITTGEQISRSPLNNSSAHQRYSFPKSERFKPYLTTYCDKFYDLPSLRSTRTTSFGFGTKSDFTKKDKQIKTDFNYLDSDFDQKHPHGPKYSFPVGRDKYEKVYYENGKILDKTVPGPGKYNYLKSFGSDALKFTMKGRIDPNRVVNPKVKKTTMPGPGAYDIVIKTNTKGKYPISNIPNYNSIGYNYDKEKRFNYKYNNFPGPETYPQKQLLGVINNSKYRSHGPITMYGRFGGVNSRLNYPGPGSYITPSDFGIYQGKDADKYPKENVWPIKTYPVEDKPWRHGMKKIKPKKEEEDNNNDNEYMEPIEKEENKFVDNEENQNNEKEDKNNDNNNEENNNENNIQQTTQAEDQQLTTSYNIQQTTQNEIEEQQNENVEQQNDNKNVNENLNENSNENQNENANENQNENANENQNENVNENQNENQNENVNENANEHQNENVNENKNNDNQNENVNENEFYVEKEEEEEDKLKGN